MYKKVLCSIFAFVISLAAAASAAAEGADGSFAITSDSVSAGQKVTLRVSVSDSTELSGFRLFLDYDEDVFTLVSAEEVDAQSVIFGPEEKVPFTIVWLDALGNTDDQDGTYAELVFETNEYASPGEYDFTLSYNEKDCIDISGNPLDFSIENGRVTIIESDEKVTTAATKQPDDKKTTSAKQNTSSGKRSSGKKTTTTTKTTSDSQSTTASSNEESSSDTDIVDKKTSKITTAASDDSSSSLESAADESLEAAVVTATDDSTSLAAEVQSDSSDPSKDDDADNSSTPIAAIIAAVSLFAAVFAAWFFIGRIKKNK